MGVGVSEEELFPGGPRSAPGFVPHSAFLGRPKGPGWFCRAHTELLAEVPTLWWHCSDRDMGVTMAEY